MPTYDYRCPGLDELVTVRHAMAEKVRTCGELCRLAERGLGEIAAETPVEKVLSFGAVVRRQSLNNPSAPPCMSGGGCPSGGCRG